MNITVNIQATELAKAIEVLAAALSGKKGFEQIVNQEPISPVAIMQAAPIAPVQQSDANPFVHPVNRAVFEAQQSAPTAVPTAPMQPPVQQPVAPAAPVQQPQVVPTSAPTYTMDQLAVAATQLMDAGKRNELLQLLTAFGVQALTALPKEHYGAFATKLREMGAQI